MTGEQRLRTVAEHLAQALALVAPLPSVDRRSPRRSAAG